MSKTNAARITELNQKCFAMSPGNLFILGSKVKVTASVSSLQTEHNLAAAAAYISNAGFPGCNSPPHKQS